MLFRSEELDKPKEFLASIHTRLNDHGYLIIASSYDWKEQTRENWPGGFKKDGEPVTSLDGIKDILENNFTMERDPINLKAKIKISSRVKISKLSEITLWKKR